MSRYSLAACHIYSSIHWNCLAILFYFWVSREIVFVLLLSRSVHFAKCFAINRHYLITLSPLFGHKNIKNHNHNHNQSNHNYALRSLNSCITFTIHTFTATEISFNFDQFFTLLYLFSNFKVWLYSSHSIQGTRSLRCPKKVLK